MKTANLDCSSNRISKSNVQAYFQPVIALDTGNICAIEARVRLAMPGERLVTAAKALALARQTGQMPNMDCTMLKLATDALHAMDSAMVPSVPLAINVSKETVEDPLGVDAFNRTLMSTSIPLELIRFEVPAETAMTEPVQHCLREWHAAGFALTLDHVKQSGQLELAKQLHCGVKLSEDFFSDKAIANGSAEKVQRLLANAKALGLHTAAEGVRQTEQLVLLHDVGCDEAQGLLISRPRQMSDLIFLLKHGCRW